MAGYDYISTIKTKLSRALFALRSIKTTLNQKSLTLLYNSIFHCHLRYAVQIWSCSRSSLINNLFKLQKKAIQIISGSAYNAHTEPLFKKLQILPLPDLISHSKIQFMQRFSQNFLPISFQDTWIKTMLVTLGTMKFNSIMLIVFNQFIQI